MELLFLFHNRHMIAVDAADINANGKAEIFITSDVPETLTLNSFVLEWNDHKFEKIVDSAAWYYRVTQNAARADRLMGQQRADSAVFLNTKDELGWKSDAYKAQKTLPIPSR